MEMSVPVDWGDQAEDLLNPGESVLIKYGLLRIEKIWPNWDRILRIQAG